MLETEPAFPPPVLETGRDPVPIQAKRQPHHLETVRLQGCLQNVSTVGCNALTRYGLVSPPVDLLFVSRVTLAPGSGDAKRRDVEVPP